MSVTALMLSALKAEGVPYSPASVKRTVENTATPLGTHDKFSIGHGVIQVNNERSIIMRTIISLELKLKQWVKFHCY